MVTEQDYEEYFGVDTAPSNFSRLEFLSLNTIKSNITKSVPKGAVIAGNPAKIIKYRNLDTYQMLADSNQQIMRTFDSYERLKIQEGVRKND